MEDISKLVFWEELKNFADLEEFNPTTMLDKSIRANQKNIKKNTWTLFEFNAFECARGLTEQSYNLIWPSFILPKMRLLMIKKTIPFIQKKKEREFENVTIKREQSFKLDDEIKNNILAAYKESNLELSQLLERDLSTIGYV
jgi:hypothetical protein